jgi:Flp pilus assembly protein TadG
MIRRPPSAGRSGAAAVEFAIVMNFVLVPLMIGVWELGRVVYVQQLVSSAAREGARLAAQGQTINQNGNPTLVVTEIPPASNTAQQPNIKATVYQTLIAAGLTNLQWSDVTVTFRFRTDLSPLPQPPIVAGENDQPWQGAKAQRFLVTVTIPYNRVQWTILGLVRPETISYTVEWRMMVDDPFTVNTNLPHW